MATRTLEIVRKYTADTSQWQQALQRIDRSSAQTAKSMQRMEQRMDKVGKSMKTLVSVAKGFAVGFAGAFSVSSIRGVTRFADELANTADRVGQSVETVQALRAEAEKVGLSFSATDTALQRFSRRVAEARQNTGVLAKVFEQYGVSLRDSQGNQRNVNVLLEDFRKVLSGIQDPAERNRVAMAAFDTEGVKLGQTLGTLDGSIQDVTQRLKEQGRVIDEEGIRKAAALETRWTEMTQKLQRQFQSLVIGVIDGFSQIGGAFDRMLRGLDITGAFAERFTPPTMSPELASQLEGVNEKITQLKRQSTELRENIEKAGSGWGLFGKSAAQLESDLAKVTAELTQQEKLRESILRKADEEVKKARETAKAQAAAATGSAAGLSKFNRGANIERLDRTFAANLEALLADAASKGIEVGVTSGFRSAERQAELWAQALKKYGSAAAARKWVAPPGKSQHNRGLAADLKTTAEGYKWLAQNAERYNLTFPLANERWHIEAAWARNQTKAVGSLRTSMEGLNDAQREQERAAMLQQQRMDQTHQILAQVRQTIDSATEGFWSLYASMDDTVAAQLQYTQAMQQLNEALRLNPELAQHAADVARLIGERYDEAIKGAKSATDELAESISNNVTVSFGNWIDSAVDGTFKLQDALRGLLADLAKIALRTALLGGSGGGGGLLGGLLGGLGNLFGAAKGAAFPQLALPTGVYTQPTRFMMPDGQGPLQRYARGGLLGEAGPEAVLPLRRLANGDLGVQGGGTEVVINNFTGEAVSRRSRQLGDREIIEIAIGQVEERIARGGNSLSRTFQQAYPNARRGRS